MWLAPLRRSLNSGVSQQRQFIALDPPLFCSYAKVVRITCDPDKRQWTLHERGLDMLRAKEAFSGRHFTRMDDRQNYGEPRFITAGWLA